MFSLIIAAAYIGICQGKDLYKQPEQVAESIYTTVSYLEKQVYSKEYSLDNIITRIDRLEVTIYGRKTNESVLTRLDEIKKTLNLKNEKKCDDKNEIMLSLLEKKYFNTDYPTETNEKRLTRLETQIYGKPSTEQTKERLSNLFQKVPLNTTGISLSDKSGSDAIYLPKKNGFKTTNQKSINQISKSVQNISQSKFAWKNNPVRIFITPSKDLYFSESAIKAVNFWKPYYNIELSENYGTGDIIIDLKDRYFVTVYKDKINYPNPKVFIYSGRYLNNEHLEYILAHEIGHALGIWKHSSNPADIMYDYNEVRFDIERKGDINNQNQSIKTAPEKPSSRDLEILTKSFIQDEQ